MDNTSFAEVDNYIGNLLAREDKALGDISITLEKEHIPNQGVSAVQGKFIHTMAKAAGARNILELGTFAGYSTIWLARALPADGKLITLEYSERHAAIAQQQVGNAGLSHLVEIKTGKALDILPALAKEITAPFDFIFIDADKPPYAEYFEWALRMSRPGTIIIADNVVRHAFNPDITDEKANGVRRFNEMLGKRTDVTATILQMVGAKEHDGMAIIVVN